MSVADRVWPVSDVMCGLAFDRPAFDRLAFDTAAADNGGMRTIAILCLAPLLLASPAAAWDTPQRLPFTATLNNAAPLLFGMSEEQAAAALNAPMKHIRGKPGDEVFAVPVYGWSGIFPRHDQIFLQFRKGRLTGYKGDWGSNWMWE